MAVEPRTGQVYIGSDQSRALLTIDGRTGRFQGSTALAGPPVALSMDARRGRLLVLSLGFATHDIVLSVVAAGSAQLLSSIHLDPQPGTAVGYSGGAVAVVESTGRAVVTSMDTNEVYFLDVRTGTVLHTVTVGRLPQPPDAVAVDGQVEHVVIIVDRARTATLLDARTGAVLRTVTVGVSPQAVAVDERTHRAFVVNEGPRGRDGLPVGTGSVSVLDMRSGAVLRTIGVGVAPHAVALDARTGRVFVVNEGIQDARGMITTRGSVSVLDAQTGIVLRTVALGLQPIAVAVDDRIGRAFIVDHGGRLIRDTWSWLPAWLRRSLPFSGQPQIVVVPGSVDVIDATQ